MPYLDSLNILSLLNRRVLSNDDDQLHHCLITNNRIKKIYLKKLNNIEELDMIMKFSPRMIYLKIDEINNMVMELFLRRIFKKIQDESNEYLRLICLRIPCVGEQVIEKFHQMIRSENLLFNYTIKRILDNIYLQWK